MLELVYLWVEDYKNIHKQGFNFSPRFTCKYDEEKNELTIDKNDNYIENFFGKNINVTAIVGKNGSGKSSIVTFLEEADYYVGSAFSNKEEFRFLICLEVDDKLHILSTIKKLKCSSHKITYKEKQLDFDTQEKDYLFYTYCSFLTLLSEFPYLSDSRENLFMQNKTINYDSKNIANLAIKNTNSDFKFDFKLTTFMYYPKKLFLNDDSQYKEQLIKKIQPIEAVYSNNPENGSEFPPCYDDIKNMVPPDNALQAYMIRKIIVDAELCIDFFEKAGLCIDFFAKIDRSKLKIDLQEFYNDEEYELNEEGYDLEEYEKLISDMPYNINTITNKEKELITKYNNFLVFDFEDTRKRKFSDLSHGEKSIYAQFISIYNTVSRSNKATLLILDEPDLALHPEWQRKYFSEFMNTFSDLNKKIHIIITTHSPFLLSDIPKQNIIFLDKDKNGKCKVVDGLKEKKETFGANIHTLLSDSFFMEDGLMGEFAKGKIDEVIKLLNRDSLDKKELKYCQQIISIIGEPIVKNQLQRVLDSKRLKKVDEIDAIKKSIEAMQKRLDELEK